MKLFVISAVVIAVAVVASAQPASTVTPAPTAWPGIWYLVSPLEPEGPFMGGLCIDRSVTRGRPLGAWEHGLSGSSISEPPESARPPGPDPRGSGSRWAGRLSSIVPACGVLLYRSIGKSIRPCFHLVAFRGGLIAVQCYF